MPSPSGFTTSLAGVDGNAPPPRRDEDRLAGVHRPLEEHRVRDLPTSAAAWRRTAFGDGLLDRLLDLEVARRGQQRRVPEVRGQDRARRAD